MSLLVIGSTALVLGLRHGLDVDHFAAILDMAGTSATDNRDKVGRLKKAFKDLMMPAFYIFGHAAMVVALGLAVLYFGAVIPEWLGALMERAVGVTLLFLSAYLIYSLVMYAVYGKAFKLRSRWMVLFDGTARASSWLYHKLFKRRLHVHSFDKWDQRGAFIVGLIHGSGAETGTQLLLLASVAGAGNVTLALYMLLTFTLGMLFSTIGIAVCVSAGLAGSKYFTPVMVVLGILAAVFSLIVGVYFALGAGDSLPWFK